MDKLLQQLLDKDAIRDVLYSYCRGIDRCDEALIRSVYHPSATDEHGFYSGSAEGFAEWVMPLLQNGFLYTQHALTNILIELDGDVAHVESYVHAFHRVPHVDGDRDMVIGARYADRFERRAGVWKIATRRVLYDWSRNEPARDAPEVATDAFAHGERSRADVSYERTR